VITVIRPSDKGAVILRDQDNSGITAIRADDDAYIYRDHGWTVITEPLSAEFARLLASAGYHFLILSMEVTQVSATRIKLREEGTVLDLIGPEDADVPAADEEEATIIVVIGGFVGILQPRRIIYDWF
jgi:hypothetical protein